VAKKKEEALEPVGLMAKWIKANNKILFSSHDTALHPDFYIDLSGIIDPTHYGWGFRVVEYQAKAGILIVRPAGPGSPDDYTVLKFVVTKPHDPAETFSGYTRYDFDYAIETLPMHKLAGTWGGETLLPLSNWTYGPHSILSHTINGAHNAYAYIQGVSAYLDTRAIKGRPAVDDLRYECYAYVGINYIVQLDASDHIDPEEIAVHTVPYDRFFVVKSTGNAWGSLMDFTEISGLAVEGPDATEAWPWPFYVVTDDSPPLPANGGPPDAAPDRIANAHGVLNPTGTAIVERVYYYNHNFGTTAKRKVRYYDMDRIETVDDQLFPDAPAMKGGGISSRIMGVHKEEDHYLIGGVFYNWDDPIPTDPTLYPFGKSSQELIVARDKYKLKWTPVIDVVDDNPTWGEFYSIRGKWKDKTNLTGQMYAASENDPWFVSMADYGLTSALKGVAP
jgi:hypothetical protein